MREQFGLASPLIHGKLTAQNTGFTVVGVVVVLEVMVTKGLSMRFSIPFNFSVNLIFFFLVNSQLPM
jgi:hypothetical protein